MTEQQILEGFRALSPEEKAKAKEIKATTGAPAAVALRQVMALRGGDPRQQESDKAAKRAAPYEKMQAFGEGAKAGLLSNFDDEFAGLAAKAGAWVGGRDVDPEFLKENLPDPYTTGRNEAREQSAERIAKAPGYGMAGEVTGGILQGVAPGLRAIGPVGKSIKARAATGAAIGAGMAALSGAGRAEEMEDVPAAALDPVNLGLGAGLGAAGGALFGKLGDKLRAAKPLAEEAPSVAPQGLQPKLPRAAGLRNKVADKADEFVKAADEHPFVRMGANAASAGVGAPGAPEAAIGAARLLRKIRPKAPSGPSMPGVGSLADDVGSLTSPSGLELQTPVRLPSSARPRGRNAPDADAMLAELKAKMARGGNLNSEAPTQQIDAGDIMGEAFERPLLPKPPKPKGAGWLPTDDVDDEIADLMAGRGQNDPSVVAARDFAKRFEGADAPQPLPERAPRPPAAPEGSAQAPAEPPPFQDVTSTVPRLDMGEVEQMLQDLRAEKGTGNIRAPKAPPKGLDFPEPAPAAQESVRPMVADPLDRAQAGAFDLPPLAEPTTQQIRGRAPAPPPPAPERWEGWNAAAHDPDWTPPKQWEGIDPETLAPSFQGGKMREWWEVGPETKMGARNDFNRNMDPEATKEIRPGALDALKNLSRRGSGPDMEAGDLLTRAEKQTDPFDSFFQQDFAQGPKLNDPQAYATIIAKAKASGMPRERARALAEKAGWPPEVMQWLGLGEAAPAPKPIRKKKPK
jgi:hypothetical protein